MQGTDYNKSIEFVLWDMKDDDVPTKNSGLCTIGNLSVKNINISKKPKYVISFIELVKVVTLVGEILLYITVTTPLSESNVFNSNVIDVG